MLKAQGYATTEISEMTDASELMHKAGAISYLFHINLDSKHKCGSCAWSPRLFGDSLNQNKHDFNFNSI